MVMIILQVLLSALVFAAVFMPVWVIFRYPVPTEPPVHRRIARAVGADRDTIFEMPVIAPVMNLTMPLAQRFNVPAIRRQIRQDLEASGNPNGYSVDQFVAICLLGGIATGSIAGLIELALGGALLLITVPVFAGVGFGVPLWVLNSAARRRVDRIAKQLPYTLDLVALVMAAGSSFTEAVESLIRDHPDDDLNQELQIALSELKFGTTRAQALANLAARIPLESLRSVVGAVNQADRLGTPLAEIFKTQADMLRMQRSVRAEKLSASAGLKILIPSMLILMAVVIIVFSTMIIRWMRGELM